MKKETSLRTLGCVVAVGLSVLVANPATAREQVPRGRTIGIIQQYDTYAAIRYSGPSTAAARECPGNLSNRAVVIDWSEDSDAKTFYVSVLTAKALGETVGFGVENCHSWGGGTPIVYRVDVGQ